MNTIFHWYKARPVSHKRVLFMLACSIPVLLFLSKYLLTGNKLSVGDGDYITQTYEAARISILKYHQFPWWNPWVSGGVPLFANPQYGLISIQSLTTLLFGSIIGYKIAVSFYFLLGFFGFYLLFRKVFRTPLSTALLLSYVWTFSSFLVHRTVAGHYTFLCIQFFPWILLVLLNRRIIKRSWLYIGLLVGLAINSAPHNTTVQMLVVIGILAIILALNISLTNTRELIRVRLNVSKRDLVFWVKAFIVVLIIAGYKIFFSLQYIKEYPRLFEFPETSMGIPKALYAVFGPLRQYTNTPHLPVWGWAEASTYIGLTTGIAAVLTVSLMWSKRKSDKSLDKKILSPVLIVVLGVLFFAFGLGTIIGNASPYRILSHFPVLSSMRVSSRWLVWSAIFVLLFIATNTYSKYRKIVDGLLLISVIQLFVLGSNFLPKSFVIQPSVYPQSSVINQQLHYDTNRLGLTYDENLTATTKSNIGQIVAGDALIDTRWSPPYGINTIRCDSDNQDCNFVKTQNAVVSKWSPNKIELKRTGPGDILLNMNPGNQWLVNNHYIFANDRLSEPGKEFRITDQSEFIHLKLQPRFSINWALWKLF
jgi:hypothetical protein